jgi:hypothetical protein
VVQCGHGAGFLFEARAAAGVAGKIGGQNLDCHFAAQARIARAVDFAHRAGAEARQNFIRAQAGCRR